MKQPVIDVTVVNLHDGTRVMTGTKRAFNAGVRATEAAVRTFARASGYTYEGSLPRRAGDVYVRRWTSPGAPSLLAISAVRIEP